MGIGQRLGLALIVVALLAGLATVTPQLPADAAGQATFTHVFGDGDPFEKQFYEVPDPFTFTEGAYVLAITATVYFGDDPVPRPIVEGKNLEWDLVEGQSFVSRTGERTWLAIYQAWADEPSEADEANMTFNFGPDISVHRHVRSFIESTEIDRADEPIVQFAWSEGDNATSAAVDFDNDFSDPENTTTVFAAVKHLQGAFDGPNEPLTVLGDISAQAPGGGGADPVRLLTAFAPGEVQDPSASWSGDATWEAVAVEVVTDAFAVPTTTTTEATTTTTEEATTTTTPATTSTTIVETEPPDVDPFVDDDGSIFENDIEAIAALGITLGCNPPTNDHFCPDDTLTRGQMAAFMARALGLESDPIDRFVDDDESVFENDIEAIAEAGITLGCNPPTNDMYCPQDTLTRGQMAAFMARALGLTGDPDDRFIDDDQSVFENDIELIAEVGITLGCNPPTNDMYCPNNTLTRGQMAAFLNRMLGYLGS